LDVKIPTGTDIVERAAAADAHLISSDLQAPVGDTTPMPTMPFPFTPLTTSEGDELPVFPNHSEFVSVPCSSASKPLGLLVPMPTLPVELTRK
jgi:hypothetical protein